MSKENAKWARQGPFGDVAGWKSKSNPGYFKIYWEPKGDDSAVIRALLTKQQFKDFRQAVDANKTFLQCWKIVDRLYQDWPKQNGDQHK
jgi:hypothetical protein